MSVNKVLLIGHLGRDPEIKSFDDGNMLANVALATSERYTDRNGAKQESTEWHRLVFRGPLADTAKRYLRKGERIYAEGSLKTRSWEQHGEKRFATEVQVLRMEMLGSPKGGGGSSMGGGNQRPREQDSGRNAYRDAKEGRIAMPPPVRMAAPAPLDDFSDQEIPF